MSRDGRDYWLVPPELYAQLNQEFSFDFDPCPFPKPQWNGLTVQWGQSNFVNPPFLKEDGGISHWIYKGLEEYKAGKKVIFVLPANKYMALLLEQAEIRNLGLVRWGATDGSGKSMARNHSIAAILDPTKPRKVA